MVPDSSRPLSQAEQRLEDKFWEYHNKNPWVYNELVKLARETQQAGYQQIGIKTLWENLRWRRMIHTNDRDGYKLNNNYPSRYARLIMEQEEDLANMFKTRGLRS